MKRIILATAATAAISSRYTTAATTNNINTSNNNNSGYNPDVAYGTYNQQTSWKRRHQESRRERRPQQQQQGGRRRTQRQHSVDTPPSSDPPLFSSNTSPPKQQLSEEEEYNKMKEQYELQLSKEEYEESYLRDDGEGDAQHLNEPHWSEAHEESEEHSKTEEMLLQQQIASSTGGEEGGDVNVNEVSFTSSAAFDNDDDDQYGHESVGPGKTQTTDDTYDDGMVQISTAANTNNDDDNNGTTEEEVTHEEEGEEEDNFNNALMVGIDSNAHPEKKGKSSKGKSSKGGVAHHNNQGSTGGKGGNGWHSNGLLEEIEAQVEEEAENHTTNGGHGQTSESNNMNGSSSNMEEGVHAFATGKSGKGAKLNGGGSSSSWNTSAKPTPSNQGDHQGDGSTQDDHETDTWSKPYTIFDPKTSKLFKTSKSHKSTKKGNWWSPSWPSPPTSNSPTPNNTTSTSYPTMTPTLSNDEYPPLTWLGVEGCTIDSPCPACSGDCDESSDCLPGLDCYKRTNSNDVPGCTSGGVGDIPGADYCYDPSLVGNTTTAPSIASFPTYSPVEQPSPTPPPQEPSIPVPLTWVGVNGCTPTQPCDACFGDCDADTDCQSADGSSVMACYKRADGDTSQVPGCLTGGDGDIPGADYCYVVKPSAPSPPSPSVGDLPTPQFTTSSTPSPQGEGVDAYFIRSQARGGSSSSFSTQAIAAMRSDPPKTRYLKKTRSLQALVPNRPGLNSGYSRPDQNFTFGGDEESGYQEEEQESSQVYQDQVYQDPAPTMYQDGEEPSDQVYQVYQGSGDSSTAGGTGWCVSGALSPNYYQLLLEDCIPDSLTSSSSSSRLLQRTGGTTSNTIVARMEQMDQLWSMDTSGYIHSIYDYDRCMMIPSSSIPSTDTRSVNEVPVEIGPCNDVNALNRFYYDSSSSIPNVLKLQGYDTLCVTFLGGDMATKGSQMILDQCESQDKFGWDFVHEDELDSSSPPPPQPSPPSSSELPELRYLGRDGCNEQSTCPACSGDCDTDADCQTGLKCYERDRDTSPQVPGCGVGGPGDIAGADYCYEPSNDGSSSSPPPPPSSSSQEPQLLNWIGVGGCTVDNPCPACSGDCDSDLDCQGSCYKRSIGESTPIPGCAVGGMGDIPGGDYCYDSSSSSETVNPGQSRPVVPQPTPPSPTPESEPSSPSTNNSESSESGYPTLSPTVLSDESDAPTGSRSTGSLPVSQGTSDTTGTQTVSTPSHTSSNSSGGSTTPSYPGTKSSKAALEPISSSVVSNERVRQHASTKAEREQEIEELEEEIKELQEEDEAEEIEEFFLNQKRGHVSTHAEREKDNK